MPEQTELARGRAIVERWYVLAEQRLDYLTELFESGQWKRYFTEVAFLENIQEAKLAVGTWRALLEREASSDNRPIDLSWLGRRPVPPRLISLVMQPAYSPAPRQRVELKGSPIADLPHKAPEPAPPNSEPADQPPWTEALNLDILQQRYPLLRNVL